MTRTSTRQRRQPEFFNPTQQQSPESHVESDAPASVSKRQRQSAAKQAPTTRKKSRVSPQPTRPPRSPRSAGISSARASKTSASAKALVGAMRQTGSSTETVISNWHKHAERDSDAALTDLMNALCCLAGAANPKVSGDCTFDDLEEESVSDLILDLEDNAPEGPTLVSAKKKQQRTREMRNFAFFWNKLALIAVRNSENEELSVIKLVLNMLVPAAETAVFNIRFVASIAVLEICTAVVVNMAAAQKRAADLQRQLDSARAKDLEGRKVTTLKQKLEKISDQAAVQDEIVDFVVQECFSSRFRDVNSDIRLHCVRAVQKWIVQLPSKFFSDAYTRYIGWLLHDKDSAVRLGSVESILAILDSGIDEESGLQNFVDRFTERIVGMVDDVDPRVALAALKLIRKMQTSGYVQSWTDEQAAEVHGKVFDELASDAIRAEALHFLCELIVEFESDSDSVENRRVQLDALTRLAVQHLDSPEDVEFVPLLVSAALFHPKSAPARVLSDSAVVLELCMSETSSTGDPLAELEQSIALQILVSLLQSSAQQRGSKSKAAKGHALDVEGLMKAVLNALPDLLSKYRSSPAQLELVLKLIGFLDVHLSSSKEKAQFRALLSRLEEVFRDCSSEASLVCISKGLSHLAKDDQNLCDEVEGLIGKLITPLDDSVFGTENEDETGGSAKQRGKKGSRRRSRSDSPPPAESGQDREHTLLKRLRQLRCLCMHNDVLQYTGVSSFSEEAGRIIRQRSDIDAVIEKSQDLALAGDVLIEAMWLQYYYLQWHYQHFMEDSLLYAGEDGPDGEDEEVAESIRDSVDLVVKLRGELIQSLTLLLSMHCNAEGNIDLSEDHYGVVIRVQGEAFACAGDLRCIFGLHLSKTVEPLSLLRWVPDADFLERLQDFYESEERVLRSEIFVDEANGDPDTDAYKTRTILEPLMKASICHAEHLNRRQAAAAVGHFVHSGPDRAETVKEFSTILRKLDASKYLEVVMATLRLWYGRWVSNRGEEDEELPDPLVLFVPLAERLSKSIGGVGLVRTESMQQPLLKFLKAGVAFAAEGVPDKCGFFAGLVPFVKRASKQIKDRVLSHLQSVLDGMAAEDRRLLIEALEENDPDEAALSARERDLLATFPAFLESLGGSCESLSHPVE